LSISGQYLLSSWLYRLVIESIPAAPTYPSKLDQYELPEAKGKDLELAVKLRTENQELSTNDVELIMALTSQGLLSQMQDKGRTDYLTVFNENLDKFPGGYLRYPIDFSAYDFADIKISRTDRYQADYTNPMPNRIMIRDGIFPNVNRYSELATHYEQEVYVSFKSRVGMLADKAIGKYLSRILGRYILPQSQLHHIDEGEWELEDGSHIILTKEQSDVYESIESEYDNASSTDYPEVKEIKSLTPVHKKIVIHGIEFYSLDIAHIFHSTPLGSAVEFNIKQYDPSWLNFNDVKLIKSLLNGRLMPHTFYQGLSDSAFDNLSSKDGLLHMYNYRYARSELDHAFGLGVPMGLWIRNVQADTKRLLTYLSAIL